MPSSMEPRAIAPAWSAGGEAVNSHFGTRAMGVGDVNGDGYGDLIVGAPGFDSNRGKVYVYCGGPHGLSDKPCWAMQGEHVGDQFGDRVGQAGDVNGDGYADVFVSAPSYQGGLGRCEVYLGGKKGLKKKADWSVSPRSGAQQFGDCTHPTGDVNGDGYDDLLVGAYQALSSAGRALLYLGGPQGLSPVAAWEGKGEAESDQYGYTLGSAGDFDGDGYGDILLGAKFHDPSAELKMKAKAMATAGKAYFYPGSAQGPKPLAWTALGSERGAQFSVRGYGVGDLDGDGHPELLISEPGADEGWGAVHIYSSPGFRLRWTLRGKDLGVNDFGRAAGPAGDLNGDGYDDLVIAGRQRDQGKVFVFLGGPAGLAAKPAFQISSGTDKGGYGSWVAPAGDLDGDGLDDLVIGAEISSETLSLGGKVYVFYGRQARAASPNRSIKQGKKRLNVYLPLSKRPR